MRSRLWNTCGTWTGIISGVTAYLDSLVQRGGGNSGLNTHHSTVQVCDGERVAGQDVPWLRGVA